MGAWINVGRAGNSTIDRWKPSRKEGQIRVSRTEATSATTVGLFGLYNVLFYVMLSRFGVFGSFRGAQQ